MIESSNGRFFVRYQDGQRSKRFHYANARTYANLFGGVIVHRTSGRIWPTMKPDFSPPGKNFARPGETT